MPVSAAIILGVALAAPAQGPLAVHPTNPRYFTDGTLNAGGAPTAVYLAGHQIFVEFQDNSFNKEWTKDLSRPDDPQAVARLLDWERYLEFVQGLGLNYIRSWIIWSTGSGTAAPPNKIAHPMPFARTGPGAATDGEPKFDLARFDDAFFDRVRGRVQDLQDRGVYVSIMLFELYGFLDGEDEDGQRLWEGNMVYGPNNIQGLDVDRNGNRLGEEFFSLDDPQVLKLQHAYMERMVDALNDLDNVIWEICNEAPSAAMEWQYEMVRHLREVEASKPKQHPILLSPGGWTPGGWSLHPEEAFTQGPAHCIATANGWINRDDPKVYDIGMPVFMDMDHVAPGSHDPTLVWKALTRGYHFSLYDAPFEQPQAESPEWGAMRASISHARRLTSRVPDMARMHPRGDLSSTGFCLADEGETYIVFAPHQEEVCVEALRPLQRYAWEWYDVARGEVAAAGDTSAEAPALTLDAPCEPAVLMLMAL